MTKFNSWDYVGDDRISVVNGPIKNPKKVTMTRLAAVLGLNHWKSPFGAWCEINRVAELPFVDSKYTIAGKAIEPKQIEFAKEHISHYMATPRDVYGDKVDHIWDFYPDNPIFGGMWDALVKDRHGNTIGIFEAKTSSRPQDWMTESGEYAPPANYAIQALGYAYMMGLEDVWVGVSFLEPDDYDDPENFVCTTDNTRFFMLSVSQGINGVPTEVLFDEAQKWYDCTCSGNLSPTFDTKIDAEYLDIMRTSHVPISDDLETLSKQTAALEDKINALREQVGIPELEKKLKDMKDGALKKALLDELEDGKTKIETADWVYAQAKGRTDIDKKALEEDGLLEQYEITKPGSWRLTRKKA